MDDIPLFPGVDKVVHFCMYGGMSGMLWLEFLRNHRKYETVLCLDRGSFMPDRYEWDY